MIGGIFIPAIILVVMLFYSLGVAVALRKPPAEFTIQVTGHLWWWDVRYPDHGIVTANEIYLPAGVSVRIELKTADVIHSFWVPNLHGKMDLLPEVTNIFWLQADRPGTWRGQCAEYCGLQHALMAFMVVALPREEFDAWVAERQEPHPEPATPLLQRGQQVFFEAACHNCHAIRGTDAIGTVGPDLTHMGSRLTIGAATLPNNRGNLAGWIVNPQPLKPGNHMPASFLDSDDLHALLEYMESLK